MKIKKNRNKFVELNYINNNNCTWDKLYPPQLGVFTCDTSKPRRT